MIRVGFGYDVHRLEKGRRLILGGIAIPHDRGPVAHSDGDVLLHALCDALLGGIGDGDIGTHFPDTDPRFRMISSVVLLRETMERVTAAGYGVVNIDATIILERPKIMRYAVEMRECIAEVLSIEPDRVSIKATTSEGLGDMGKGEGVAANAVVLLEKKIVAG